MNGVVHPGQSFNGLGPSQGRCRQKLRVWKLLIEVQNDGQNLCNHLAIVNQHRNLTARIDGLIVGFVLLTFVQLDHDGLVLGACPLQHAMGHK